MSDITMNDMLLKMQMDIANAKNSSQNTSINTMQDFASILKNTITHIDSYQTKADLLAEKFEMGDKEIDVAQVIIAMQKANISLQTLMQVRNKLVSSYQEIINMPI